MKKLRTPFYVLGLFLLIVAVPYTAHSGHQAAHDGALVGLEYDGAEIAHLEMTLDPVTGMLRVYLLDSEGAAPMPVPQETLEAEIILPRSEEPLTLVLSAAGRAPDDDTMDDPSAFEAQSDRLKGAGRFMVNILSIFVNGYEINDIHFGYPEGDH